MEVYDHQNKRQGGRTGQFAAGLVVGIFTTLLVVCVAYLGFQIQQTVENARQESQQVNAGGAGQDGSLSETVADKIDRLVYMIENYYYKDDVTREDLEEGIYQGLMEAVGDPYTNYFTADDFETFMEQATGAYYGIGAYVAQDVERNYPKINSPIPGSPAEEVGMRPDDIIYEVDGVSTYGMDLDKVVSLIKGEEGTTVNITLYRKGEYLDVEVQRRQVEIPTVEQKMLGDGMAYIRIIEFDDVTPGQFRTALDASRGSGMKGLVLDLRGNPEEASMRWWILPECYCPRVWWCTPRINTASVRNIPATAAMNLNCRWWCWWTATAPAPRNFYPAPYRTTARERW